MSYNKSSDEAEYAAVIAAAAYAITSLESDHVNQLYTNETTTPLAKITSKISSFAIAITELGEAIRSTGEQEAKSSANHENFDAANTQTDEMRPKKRIAFADQPSEEPSMPSAGRTPTVKHNPSFDEELFENERVRPPTRASTVKKIPIVGEEGLDDGKTTKPAFSASEPISPSQVPLPQFPTFTTDHDERDAEAWERKEMTRIKEKFEKLNGTILEWENKKMMKAKHKLEMAERPPKMRARAMQVYQTAMQQIKQIADAARIEARESLRNDELELKEKANRYRTTGEPPLPTVYHCF